MKILIVEDETKTGDYLRQGLTEAGFVVDLARDGLDGLHLALTGEYDLILLDVMLPGESGLSLARTLAAEDSPPIIMLSARGEEIDRVVGLEVGADDYLPKPFSHRELLARIAAVLRRRSAPTPTGRLRRFGPFEVDLEARRLARNGQQVEISGAEFKLLEVLLEHPDRVLSRDALVELLKGYERAPFDRMVDVRVTRLRRRIEPDPARPIYLRTIWGEGYLFSPGARP